MTSLVSLYPGWWRARYGDEVTALLEERPPTRRDRIDLARGALDAWLHPPTPSRAAPLAALIGGGLWTMLATITALQPVPADWPGYLLELVPLAIGAAAALGLATLGAGLRRGDRGGRSTTVALWLAALGTVAWVGALIATSAGSIGPLPLAVAQTVALVGMACVGLLLIRAGDLPIGLLIASSSVLLLLPSTVGWLGFGAAWTAVGLVSLVERRAHTGPAGLA